MSNISRAEQLEVELNNKLNFIPLFKSANIMHDGKVLLIRINNSLNFDTYANDVVEYSKQIKETVPNYFPNYESWTEFDYGASRDFIVFIYVNKEK